MAKTILRNLDQLMRHLEQSDAFTRLLDKVAKAFGFRPQAQIKEKLVEKIVVKEVTPKWAKSLEEYQRLLVTVQQHPVLSDVLLPHIKGGDELVTLLANLAQWDNVERIWDELAAKAKQGQEISSAEQMVLEASLHLYNRSLHDHQASLQMVQSGAAYNYNVQQSVDAKGSAITQLLLPGLISPAGKLVKKPLVRTV